MYLIPHYRLVVAEDTIPGAVLRAVEFLEAKNLLELDALDNPVNFEIFPLTRGNDHIAYVAEETDASQPQH